MKIVLILSSLLALGYSSDLDLSKIRRLDVVNTPIQDIPLPGLLPLPNPPARIVGGTEVKPHSLPYQVGLLLHFPNGQSWCGGSLISRQFVITAAHCVDGVSSVTLFLGSHNIQKQEQGELRIDVPSRNFIINSGWNPNVVANDIALIRLPYQINLNAHIQTVNLPRRSQIHSTFEGQIVKASGWGRYSDASDNISPVLQYVDVKVTSQNYCKNYFQTLIRPSNICTDGSTGKSACNGDSGGPLVLQESNGSKTLVGLTSFGSSAGCQKGWPAVFTRITSFLDWISVNTGIPIKN